jgi:hypothetical protein
MLVEGLKTGDADIDRDGWISVNDLHEYIRARMRKNGASQTPTLSTQNHEGNMQTGS